MNDARARFEEIWPVPFGVRWNVDHGKYMVFGMSCLESSFAAHAHNARLDTFARCWKTTAMYVGIIEELVYELETAYTADGVLPACVDRAKQIIGDR